MTQVTLINILSRTSAQTLRKARIPVSPGWLAPRTRSDYQGQDQQSFPSFEERHLIIKPTQRERHLGNGEKGGFLNKLG